MIDKNTRRDAVAASAQNMESGMDLYDDGGKTKADEVFMHIYYRSDSHHHGSDTDR
jgi:hypothetical protein